MTQSTFEPLLNALQQSIEQFIDEIRHKKLTQRATDAWSVKDELCHIVFWHENYAANYQALALHQEPDLLDGPGYKLNADSVVALHKYSIKTLIQRLEAAQRELREAILSHNILQMTYKKGGRIYKTEDFLDMVTHHINTHTKQVKRAR